MMYTETWGIDTLGNSLLVVGQENIVDESVQRDVQHCKRRQLSGIMRVFNGRTV